MANPGTLRFAELASPPSPPPAGYTLLYVKTDDVIYIMDDGGVETPLGSASSITELTGEVTAVGPGIAAATISNSAVIGKVLTGFIAGPNSTVLATDTLLQAIQKLQAQVSSTSGAAITALTGDVTATGPGSVAATVVTVGGKSAAAIATSVNDTQAATNLNTPSTIVKRDGSGNFSAGTITADLIGDVTGDVTGDLTGDVTGNLTGNVTGAASDNVLKAGDTMTGPLVINDIDLAVLQVGTNTLVVDTVNNRIGINKLSPTEALDVVGNGVFTGTVTASNISGSNTGDVTVTDTNSIDLTLTGQNIQADLKLSPDAADAGFIPVVLSVHANGLHSEVAYDTPVQVGTSNFIGTGSKAASYDHVHAHGNQTSPTLHALATNIAHGFMSSTDKAKIDAELPTTIGTANQVLGVNAAGTAGEYKSLLGTTNQITITDGVGTKTFATPQDIHTGATPTFAGENLTTRLEFTQTTTPTTPAATKADIYIDNSNGFSRLRYLDETGSVQTILRDTIFLAFNNTGSTITKGQAVYVTGSTGTVMTIGLAKADASSTVPALGLAYESIANGAFGRVMSIGILTNVDTSAFSTGQRVYLSATTAGALTATKPISPNIWQRVGVVLNAAVSGSLEVRPLGTHGEESGTNTAFTLNVVALIDAATIATDASLGNTFTVTLGGNRTLGAPTNPTNGQKIVYRIKQDGTGGRTLAFDAIFSFGLDIISFTPSSGANKTDYIGCIYDSVLVKWHVVAVSKGF